MIEGTPKATGLAISSVTAAADMGGWKTSVKIRFISSENGLTYSYTEANNLELSRGTKELFDAFMGSLEMDAAKRYLNNTFEASTKGLDMSDPPPDKVPSGIGEHIGEEQA